jgi:hypothetical protein
VLAHQILSGRDAFSAFTTFAALALLFLWLAGFLFLLGLSSGLCGDDYAAYRDENACAECGGSAPIELGHQERHGETPLG